MSSVPEATRVARQAASSSKSKKSPAQGRAFRSLALVQPVASATARSAATARCGVDVRRAAATLRHRGRCCARDGRGRHLRACVHRRATGAARRIGLRHVGRGTLDPRRSRTRFVMAASIQYSPGFSALAAALARHVSTDAAGIMRAPFALANAEELRAMVAKEGFRDITIESVEGSVCFPSVSRFVQDYVRGSPLGGHVTKVSDETRMALVNEVCDALTSYVAGDGLKFPIKAHLASARKRT
jgi:hypothetical protein